MLFVCAQNNIISLLLYFNNKMQAHCVSSNAALAAVASQHLYLLCCTNASLLTENFARMKVQLTIALSQFVSQGTKSNSSATLQ